MRAIILFPEEYKNKKAKLLEILTIWDETIHKYITEYKGNNQTLIYAWTETFKAMNKHLKSDRNNTDCFLIVDNDGQLQGIAFGAKLARGNFSDAVLGKHTSSYHIFDMLIAPWNMLGRAFSPKSEENGTSLEDKYKKIGTRLIKLIVTHAQAMDVVQIVAEPRAIFEVGHFFSKTLFTQAYVQVGLSYELYQPMFPQASSLNVPDDYHITVFGATGCAKMIENYALNFDKPNYADGTKLTFNF